MGRILVTVMLRAQSEIKDCGAKIWGGDGRECPEMVNLVVC